MAAHRPTQAEHDKRVKDTARLLAAGYRKGEIKTLVAQKWSCSPRSVDRYLRYARALLIESSDEPHNLHKARSLATYQDILQTTDNDRDRLQAQTRIDKILGLETQFNPLIKHEHKHAVNIKLMEEVRKKPELRNRLMSVLNELPGGFED